MNLTYNQKTYLSLQEFIALEQQYGADLYGKRLQYAHEVDSTIISMLESTHIQSVINRFADLLVNIESGTEISSGIVIDACNFPEIYESLRHCCLTLGIRIPHAVVSSSMPGINAYASGTVDNPYLLLSDLSTHLLTREELRFIIGHECGHLAMEHLVYHLIGRQISDLGKMLPVVGPILAKTVSLPLNAWNRCSEITADRAGLICCGNLRTAQRALMKLESSFANVANVDLDVYIEQSLDSLENMKVGALKEALFNHPLTPKRLKALQYFSESELYYRTLEKDIPSDKSLLTDEALKQKVNQLLTILK